MVIFYCKLLVHQRVFGFDLILLTVSGRSTCIICIGTGRSGRSGSCQLRSAHPSARSGCSSCCACGGHLCTLCPSSCDRGLYQGTNLQLGWCGIWMGGPCETLWNATQVWAPNVTFWIWGVNMFGKSRCLLDQRAIYRLRTGGPCLGTSYSETWVEGGYIHT